MKKFRKNPIEKKKRNLTNEFFNSKENNKIFPFSKCLHEKKKRKEETYLK